MIALVHKDPELVAPRLSKTALGRSGKPYDIAMSCLYLASEESAWMTGSELVIDGGLLAH